jgi:hypothetical protein
MSEQKDVERAAFEAGINPHCRRRNEHGDYAIPEIQDRWNGWQARASLPVGVPDGYALVPVEPTVEMLRSCRGYGISDPRVMETAWKRMLESAPAAPTVKAEQVQCETFQDSGIVGHSDVCPECEETWKPAPSLPAAGSAVESWRDQILRENPKSEPGYWPDALIVAAMSREIDQLRAALSAQTERQATVKAELPEPDFALDGGSQPCYYAETVQRIVAALSDELQTERARADAAVGDANDAERALSAIQSAPERVVAYRTLDRHGNPVTDWIDGSPEGGKPIVSGGSFQLAYAGHQSAPDAPERVSVPRELLRQIIAEWEDDNDRYMLARELRALLNGGEA